MCLIWPKKKWSIYGTLWLWTKNVEFNTHESCMYWSHAIIQSTILQIWFIVLWCVWCHWRDIPGSLSYHIASLTSAYSLRYYPWSNLTFFTRFFFLSVVISRLPCRDAWSRSQNLDKEHTSSIHAWYVVECYINQRITEQLNSFWLLVHHVVFCLMHWTLN